MYYYEQNEYQYYSSEKEREKQTEKEKQREETNFIHERDREWSPRPLWTRSGSKPTGSQRGQEPDLKTCLAAPPADTSLAASETAMKSCIVRDFMPAQA